MQTRKIVAILSFLGLFVSSIRKKPNVIVEETVPTRLSSSRKVHDNFAVDAMNSNQTAHGKWDDWLKETRFLIQQEMEDFKFAQGTNISHYVLEQGGIPQKAMVSQIKLVLWMKFNYYQTHRWYRAGEVVQLLSGTFWTVILECFIIMSHSSNFTQANYEDWPIQTANEP